MRCMKRLLALVAALSLVLGALLFGNRPVAYADEPQSTPTPSSGTTPNGGGSGGHTGQ